MPVSGLGLFLLLGLVCPRALHATEPFYQNNAVLNYSIQGNPPPIIDGNNYITPAFDNENVFSVTFDQFPVNPSYYEPWNMLYYTNNGTMLADSSFLTNLNVILDASYGAGFRFDLQTTNVNPRAPADTFYNAGTIRCNSLQDLFNNFFIFSDLGECLVSATNIINPGVIDVGPSGKIDLRGQNVNLSHATLTMEAFQNFFTGYANLYAFGAVGADTNKDWDPSVDLGSDFAISSLPYQFLAYPASPFFRFSSDSTGSNIVVEAVFVANNSPNAPYNVYFNSANFNTGPGAVTIEWTGYYTDPATGDQITNYLYLNDDIPLGASTNAFVQGGVPSNFTFTESNNKLIFQTPAASGFYNVFPPGVVTNRYSYVNAQLIPSSVATNASATNPHGALTNLPGRIEIRATGPGSHLNLAAAQIIGPNYLLVSATNQFDGNAGSAIVAPYSDLYLGVSATNPPGPAFLNTRGHMAFTNLVAQVIPNWNGSVLAWSTDWTNSVGGTNFDFRVEIVSSALAPTSSSAVQDLVLHATNSLVLSDALNILRTLSIDSKSLTLTTNGAGNGAESFEGELNVKNTGILWHSALPNLRWLTNNGAITTGNLIQFGGAARTNWTASFVNRGFVSDQGAQIWTTNFENSGTISNGVGNFDLNTQTATITNGLIQCAALTIAADQLVVSNVSFQPTRSLTLQVSHLLTDTTVTNGNFWTVGNPSGVGGNGLALPVKPQAGDLLGTTILVDAPGPNKQIFNTWAAEDRGVSVDGFTNNAALGRLRLDSFGPLSQFVFNGTGAGNALYVDDLELSGYATNTDFNGDFTALNLNTNSTGGLVIYYAQARLNGVSVAAKMNHRNGNHLRWVAAYVGHFSSTNLVYPDGTTNTVNAALAASTGADSDGDGTVNAADPTPFFVPSQVALRLTLTNAPAPTSRISWDSIPGATDVVLYGTNLLGPMTNVLTIITNSNIVPPPGGWPITNSVSDPVHLQAPRYYRVEVEPNATNYFGPAYFSP